MSSCRATTAERVTFPALPHTGGRMPSTDTWHLEGRLTYPDGIAPRGGVLLLAPHPHFAGDLDNNVLRALEAAVAPRGWATLAFNYRGIGASAIDPGLLGSASGTESGMESVYDYWERVERETRYGEILPDAGAARAFLARQLDTSPLQPSPLHLVGYSFGALLAALLTRELRGTLSPASLTLVAPPIRRFPLPFLAELALPRLLVLAAEDFLYGRREIAAFRRLPPPRRVEVVEDADHFFRGLEGEAASRVAGFLATLETRPTDPIDHPTGGEP